jgi:outer membrane protein OmpA-like peptidoglycan-associated protein
MRSMCAVLVLVAAATAAAQPVSYELKPDVALGQKPQIRITAATKVTNVKIELARDDGKKVSLRQAALAKGQAVTFSIGDGAAGKASYTGTISAQDGDTPWSQELAFDTMIHAPVHVGYDAAHLDLDKRTLQFTMSRPAGSAELSAIGEDGSVLGKGTASYAKTAAGTWLAITWTQPANTRVLKLQLRAVAADGSAADVELIPWSVEIAHEDVNFATDSAVIEHGEEPKLTASLAKIADVVKRSEKFVKMKLYVAGHTDTVGPSAKNRKLSLDRARAIAQYLRAKGVTLPIAFAGFGEDVLKIKTKDETDERANRRADYVIGPAGAPPPFGGPYLKAKATWADLK